jgi:hypothetical protein
VHLRASVVSQAVERLVAAPVWRFPSGSVPKLSRGFCFASTSGAKYTHSGSRRTPNIARLVTFSKRVKRQVPANWASAEHISRCFEVCFSIRARKARLYCNKSSNVENNSCQKPGYSWQCHPQDLGHCVNKHHSTEIQRTKRVSWARHTPANTCVTENASLGSE